MDRTTTPPAGDKPAGMTFEQYLVTRIPWPERRPSLTLEQIRQAIADGALASAGHLDANEQD
jgi:hypothetical protein